MDTTNTESVQARRIAPERRPADDVLRLSWLDIAAIVLVVGFLAMAFLTPTERTQGDVARLFYLHVPGILMAYIAFGVALAGSIAYLLTRRMRWDHLAVAGAEVGVVFTGLTLVVGMIWAKPTWGVYWTWSARLTLTAIMFFVYLGYLTLRRAIDDPAARARRAAIYGTFSIVQVRPLLGRLVARRASRPDHPWPRADADRRHPVPGVPVGYGCHGSNHRRGHPSALSPGRDRAPRRAGARCRGRCGCRRSRRPTTAGRRRGDLAMSWAIWGYAIGLGGVGGYVGLLVMSAATREAELT